MRVYIPGISSRGFCRFRCLENDDDDGMCRLRREGGYIIPRDANTIFTIYLTLFPVHIHLYALIFCVDGAATPSTPWPCQTIDGNETSRQPRRSGLLQQPALDKPVSVTSKRRDYSENRLEWFLFRGNDRSTDRLGGIDLVACHQH